MLPRASALPLFTNLIEGVFWIERMLFTSKGTNLGYLENRSLSPI